MTDPAKIVSFVISLIGLVGCAVATIVLIRRKLKAKREGINQTGATNDDKVQES